MAKLSASVARLCSSRVVLRTAGSPDNRRAVAHQGRYSSTPLATLLHSNLGSGGLPNASDAGRLPASAESPSPSIKRTDFPAFRRACSSSLPLTFRLQPSLNKVPVPTSASELSPCVLLIIKVISLATWLHYFRSTLDERRPLKRTEMNR